MALCCISIFFLWFVILHDFLYRSHAVAARTSQVRCFLSEYFGPHSSVGTAAAASSTHVDPSALHSPFEILEGVAIVLLGHGDTAVRANAMSIPVSTSMIHHSALAFLKTTSAGSRCAFSGASFPQPSSVISCHLCWHLPISFSDIRRRQMPCLASQRHHLL